jgi:DNA-binding LacI/PurR family transcriptional regulator/signal transduction histidine kinase
MPEDSPQPGTTIGYITADLNTGYNFALWQGIKEACKKGRKRTLLFMVGEYKSPQLNLSMRNAVLDFISTAVVDGLIINVATLFHYVGSDEIDAFYQRYRGIPIVNIGFEIGGHPTILVDNRKGIRDGVVHLIRDHGHRKIAFIKGPGFNIESSLRYEGYVEALEQYGIEPDPDIIEEGTFYSDSGAECLEKLIRKNGKIDALVASNDEMALGALRKAQEMGILVPDDMAILGFDDIEDAACASIPLTTVRQPLLSQAQSAVDVLTGLIEKKKVPGSVVLPTELVIRKSCGCFSRTVLNAHVVEAADGLGRMKGILEKHPADKDAGPPGLPEKLVGLFLKYIEKGGDGDFLSTVNRELDKAVLSNTLDIVSWQDALSELIRATFPLVKNDYAKLIKAESFWHMARVLIQETGFSSQSYARMQNELWSATVRRINSELISSFDLAQLVQTMSDGLPRLGVEACYMSIYDNGEKREYSDHSRLILGYNGGIRERIPAEGIRFRTRDLLPQGLETFDGLSDFIVESLFFQHELFGFILLRADPRKIMLEELRQQISSTLKGALLVREVVDKERELEGLLYAQKERSKELENAYRVLKVNQEKMLIIEKMASLGRMTAGIAHEMNTPLAAVRATLLELGSLVTEYVRSVEDPEVSAEDHKEIARDMNRSLAVATKASERAMSFIQSVKSQTTGLSRKHHCLFNAVPVIEDVILLLNHALNKSGCSVSFSSAQESVTLFGAGARLSQVVTNLVMNAMDAYKDKGGGTITVLLSYGKQGVDLAVGDKGSGMEESVLQKIFDPLFTTKPFPEGTGLGLTVVHDIVVGEFGGSIEVESALGVGTTFVLHLPRPSKGARDDAKD